MSVKTRARGLVATLIVGAVVVVGFQLFQPKFGQRGTDDHLVTFSGIWTPSPHLFDGVEVHISVGSNLKLDKVMQTAPIQKIYPAQRGDTVEIRLRLVGAGQLNFLGCSIGFNGTEQAADHIPMLGESRLLKAGDRVSCWATVF